MKNIVIAGGGPIGLYTAIRISKLIEKYGLKATVTVVEPKLNLYSRPGIVAKNVLDVIERNVELDHNLLPDGDDSGSSIFIMDLEKALYKEAQNHGIKFVRGKVAAIEGKALVLEDGRKIPCEIVIDSTGPRRTLINQVNQQSTSEKKPFTIRQVADNPIKNHFVAYVHMDGENAKLIAGKMVKDPLKHALALEKLRTEFGWPHFKEPELSIRKYTPKGENKDDDMQRFYFYFEIPPELAESEPSEQLAWLKALLYLKTENDDIEFTVEDGAMKFLPFGVNPHEVTEPVYTSSGLPVVIPCGDAQIEPDYRPGIGIRSGAFRADTLVDSFMRDLDGGLVLNQEAYEHSLQGPLGLHRTTLKDEYKNNRERLDSALLEKGKIYSEALALAETPEQGEIILKGLRQIVSEIERLGVQAYRDSCQKGTPSQKVPQFKIDNYGHLAEVTSLEQSKTLLATALELLPETEVELRTQIKNNIDDLAMSYKAFAALKFSSKEYGFAHKFYNEALSLLTSNMPGEHKDEIAKIYSNLALIAKAQKKYDLVKDYVDKGLQELGSMLSEDRNTPDMKTIYAKLLNTQCNALFDEVEANITKLDSRDHPLNAKLQQGKDLCNTLIENSLIHSSSAKILSERLAKVERAVSEKLEPLVTVQIK
ncbi:Tryptophan halogenase [Legionella massiliensis]|uniref:Tryptophan halogenase n=1 Tax=Legionella massiliensis TaxID=1034943 RepID=A0A078KXL7_9GAMM|nr:hypothetical protein [Legionella massiliensis]CDZ79155.1 Tryptophan halogenase [Legionella massiliensis]CEE14893.1 Tryptophan halogenase [Legionella massiliensis]